MKIPCSQCLTCRIAHSRDWGTRAAMEMHYHEEACGLLLTYDDKHLPEHGFLVEKHMQDFFKRLRKYLGSQVKIKYIYAGEYGTKTKRPHYHVALFGYDPPDQKFWKLSPTGFPISRSETLNRIWGHGFVNINPLNASVAEYVAKYTAKKTGDLAKDHYQRVDIETGEVFQAPPEYIRVSLGIGKRYYQDHAAHMYAFDQVMVGDRKRRIPRYFDRQLEKDNPELLAQIKEQRKLKAKALEPDNTLARRRVKAKIKDLKYKYRERGKYKGEAA